MATSTPWGPSDYTKSFARGITFYGTPSHGGFKVSAGRLKKMHPALIDMGWAGMGERGWFEEDCSWCAVALAFPECFDDLMVEAAHQTAQSTYPAEYKSFQRRK